MRLSTLAVFLFCLFVQLSSSYACGVWKLVDQERGYQVGFLLDTGWISTGAGKKKYVAHFKIRTSYAPFGTKLITTTRTKGKMYDDVSLTKDKILINNQAVGRFKGSVLDLNGQEYHVQIRCIPSIEGKHSVSVNKGGKTIAEGTALPLLTWCNKRERSAEAMLDCSGDTAKSAKNEIRNRIGLYLAWRDIILGNRTAIY